jgi:putative nucleotidyltransferase with HDIG domain
MNIPSKNDCFDLMCRMKMLENIVAHSIQVCRVGMCLVDHIKIDGNRLNRGLVKAAALLHDITKTRSFETEENHAQTGAQVLAEFGYPQVGELVRQHVRLDSYSEHRNLSEAVIVNYADKRVLHDRIVSLDDRMRYIQERYGTQPEHKRRIELLWEKTAALEKHTFSFLPFSPDDLIHHLTPMDLSGEISNFRKICPQLAGGSS